MYGYFFVQGRYLHQGANSSPRTKLEENCALQGTDNVHGQYLYFFLHQNRGYCVYCPSNILHEKMFTNSLLYAGQDVFF